MKGRWLLLILIIGLLAFIAGIWFTSLPFAVNFISIALTIAGCIRFAIVYLFNRGSGNSKVRGIQVRDEGAIAWACFGNVAYILTHQGAAYNFEYLVWRSILVLPMWYTSIEKAVYLFRRNF